MIGVAFRTMRIGVIEAGPVAGLTDGNSRQQDVARFRACKGFGMAAHAREPSMRVVVEFRVRHPLCFYVGRGHPGEATTRRNCKRVALFAGFAPQQFFRFGHPFRYPL